MVESTGRCSAPTVVVGCSWFLVRLLALSWLPAFCFVSLRCPEVVEMFEVQMGADPITELSTGTPGTLRSISCGSKLFRARYGSFICEWSNCFAVLSCGVQSSCCCASVFVAKCDTWRAGAYNFNVSTRLHESQRHQASNGPLLLYRSSQSCRVGFRPNSELGFAIGRPSFEIPRSFMHQGPQGRSLPLTEKAR